MARPRKLILKNNQSPGDVVMLTAAVRDLHRSTSGQFLTDVRTPCPALWENNPYISSILDNDPEAEAIVCEYPLIHRSNNSPWHFIHAFPQFLANRLAVAVPPTEFRGDIHLTPQEKAWMSQIREITRVEVPFWIIVAGGKNDFTIKWWDKFRFQDVVNHFRDRILFVQVGEQSHYHPPLEGVIDLRGRTDLRQLVRLVHHAEGVVCPVTLLMHLAAAIETKPGRPRNRPCVVIAGGREPAQWEAYPHHQYIHTNGSLYCCDSGGCWKSRTVPLGDGDTKDHPGNLCLDVVYRSPPENVAAAEYPLPRCMDLIGADEVIRRIEMYFKGGSVRYLSSQHLRTLRALSGRLARPTSLIRP